MSDCNKANNGSLKVRQLQRTLYLKSKQCKEVRFYSLYDKIYREDVLWEAWRQVKSNRGAAGIDGKSIEAIIAQGESMIINKLQEQLSAKLYKFSSSRLVEIPKAKGGTRPLAIITSAEQQGKITNKKVGVPQGSPISPLYSNIYLNVIDQVWHSRDYPEKLRATLHRYCDDAILVCRKSADLALERFTELAKRLSLTINHEKTRITKLTEGFNFIGFNFVKRKSLTSGRNSIYVFPSKQSQQNIRSRLKHLTCRRAPIKPEAFTEQIKPIVLGWVNYFKHTNASKAFVGLQRFINNRFRRYLTHRRKGRGFGWQRYPNSKLYTMGMLYIGSGMIKYPERVAQGL